MAIKANVGNPKPVPILTTDTVLYQLPAGIDRYHVGGCNIFNTNTVNTVTIQFYISPDLTSASGLLVATIQLAALSEVDVNAVVGQGYVENIIALADIVGANGSTTATLHSEGS